MKRCPKCRRDYTDETLNFCLDDGSALVDGPASDPNLSENVTAVMDSPSTGSRTYPDLRGNRFDGGEAGRQLIPRKSSRTIWLAILTVLVLAGAGLTSYWLIYRNDKKSDVRSNVVNIQRLTGDGRTRNPAISPDGKFLVYVKLDEGKQSLWIKQVVGGSTANVVKPGEADQVFGTVFSPDGNYVYFNATMAGEEKSAIYRVPTLGGNPVKFLDDARYLQFSSDGKLVSFRRQDPVQVKETILVANADGSNTREIVSRHGKQFFTSAAAFSPDGQLLAAGIGDDDLATRSASIAFYRVTDGSVQELPARKWDYIDDLVWHPSGDSLLLVGLDNAFTEGQIFELAYPSGDTRQITNDLNGHYGISVTSDGRSIVTGERYARSAVWVSPDTKPENAKQVMPDTGDTWGLSWAPDGRIVYVSDQTGYAEVWIMNADGSNARSLTNDQKFKSDPNVSPDGRYIVYMSSSNGGRVERIGIDGGVPTVLTKAAAADNPHVSPDSKWVLYSAFVGGLPKILRVSIDGGEETQLVDYPAQEPRYSNDGRSFACFLLNEKTLEWNRLAIVPADGGQPIKVIDVPRDISVSRGPVWTPDDKAIMLIFNSGERQNLWMQPVDGSAGHAASDFGIPALARRDYSRDGKRIAIVRAQGITNAIMITDFR